MRVRDEAEAVRCLAQKAKLGLAMQNEAAEFKLRAERKAGKMLADLARRGRRGSQMYQLGTFTLDQLGISRNESSRWQREATVPEETFDAFVRASQSTGAELSTEALLRLSRTLLRQRRRRPGPVDGARGVLHGADSINDQAANGRADHVSVEAIVELSNHHATLVSILLPFLEQEQEALSPAARRHAARLLRDSSVLWQAAIRVSDSRPG